MAAVLLRAHDRNAPHDAPARLVLVKKECREPTPVVVRGARYQDVMRGAVGAGDEPFAATYDVAVVALLGARQHHGRVGAGPGMRLGHDEGRAHFAVDDRPEPLLLLRRRADLGEQVHVAVVRRHAMDAERTEDRTRRLFVDRRPGTDRQPHAAVFLGRLRRPQAGLLGLRAHRRQPLMRDVLVVGEIFRIGFERQHVLGDEVAHAQADGFDFGREREVHEGFLTLNLHHLAAVGDDGGARDVAAGVRREQQERAVEIAVLAEAAHGNSRLTRRRFRPANICR